MALGRKIDFGSQEEEKSEIPVKGRKIEFSGKEVSRLRSLLNALPKGFLTGEGMESLLPQLGPVPHELGKRATEQMLPTQDRLPENILERTGKIVRSTIGGGGGLFGTAARSLLGGAIGHGVKEAGGGELAQTLGEVSAFGLPGLGKKILPTKAQEKLVDFARRAGMTEKQIAPLMSGTKKKAFFGKVASKGEKTQAAIKETKRGIGGAYDFVSSSPEASRHLSPQSAQKYLNDSAQIANKIPYQIRSQLQHDAQDLINQGLTGENLINFYQDIGSKYKIGREHLELLKQPIIEALESISPQLAEDFKLTNELFKKRIGIGKTLKPGLASELMDLGELGKLAHSITKFSLKGIGELIGIAGARRFAREILINPRLQNITKQMEKAVVQHKFPIAIELANYIKNKYKEED
jgi:hypothetical protein